MYCVSCIVSGSVRFGLKHLFITSDDGIDSICVQNNNLYYDTVIKRSFLDLEFNIEIIVTGIEYYYYFSFDGHNGQQKGESFDAGGQ